MFDVIFGWRKATKCKNLIKRVKCRLKLLKNKRSCIVKQLKDDLGQLLRHGHYQIVFDRVDQLFMDDNMLVVYDLLENFCEFILISLPYIRRHKDCPNDINEAVSSLVFASTRLGNLPELPVIRKLFGQRYGKKFETSALELLPGNLVNYQIKENLCIKSVSNEVKYKLVDEIARICFQQGPLLLEYRNESQQEQVIMLRSKNSNIATEANIVSIDYSSEIEGTSTDYLSAIEQTSIDSVHCMKNNEQERVSNPTRCSNYSSQSTISSPELVMKGEFWRANGFISGKMTDQLAYKDDVEEFESILSKDLNFQDQRLFMFKGLLCPLMLKMDTDHINVSISPLQKTRLIAMKDASFMTDDLERCSFTFSSSSAMIRGQLYMRTRTMPVERPKDNLVDNFLQSNSFPVLQEPGEESSLKSYVHPKLPDYDEIAAMFKALKKEKLQAERNLRSIHNK
ncbi:uncharacterized protein LOC125811920 [Solanum verrucosum]|uniref:uncharacterized protein LOC125811920 n=1 Tax=Solanum verrucosum TaxID=315347 RepID=UPI0020D142F6|nr:uncharacterized protein LOC125811920 [Solanum verrucosum]